MGILHEQPFFVIENSPQSLAIFWVLRWSKDAVAWVRTHRFQHLSWSCSFLCGLDAHLSVSDRITCQRQILKLTGCAAGVASAFELGVGVCSGPGGKG